MVPKIDINLFSEDEVIGFIGKSRDTLRRWRREGGGPVFIRIGRTPYYHRRDVAAYLIENRLGPGGRPLLPHEIR